VLIIAEFDLKPLSQGKYMVKAVAHDLLKKSSTTGESEFSIQ
jgi:hypothetical protein